jgi:membrane associated rhomboid family serine protease
MVTWALIAANNLVLLYESSLRPDELEAFLRRFALIAALFFTPNFDLGYALSWQPFVTNMFLHGGWLHLIFNIWALWLFGGTVEDRMGPARYLVFHLACGFLASVTHAVVNPTSTEPAPGASGAIAGVMRCYMRLFPWARIAVIPVLFPVLLRTPGHCGHRLLVRNSDSERRGAPFMTSTSGAVAYWAHIGGFLAGLLVGPLLVRSEQPIGHTTPMREFTSFNPMARRQSRRAIGGDHAYN